MFIVQMLKCSNCSEKIDRLDTAKTYKLTAHEISLLTAQNVPFDINKQSAHIFCPFTRNDERFTSKSNTIARNTIDYFVKLRFNIYEMQCDSFWTYPTLYCLVEHLTITMVMLLCAKTEFRTHKVAVQ